MPLSILVLAALLASDPAVTVAEQFAEANQLLDKNCYECKGHSQDEFERGLGLLDELVESGYQDSDAVLRLANAFGEYAIAYLDQGSAAYEESRQRQRALYEQLLQQGESRSELFVSYANALDSDADRIKMLRRAVESDPSNAFAQYYLGRMILETKGDLEEGLGHLSVAFQLGEKGRKLDYGNALAKYLGANGRSAEADEIRKQMENYVAEYHETLKDAR